MQIEEIAVKDLKPYENNARRHQEADVSAIVASIKEFGFKDPIGVWSKDNIIVEGHGRLTAAKKLGMKTVPCIRLDDLTDEQRRAYALAHNKTAELSEWDMDLLSLELDDITDIDMTEFGFDLDGFEAEPIEVIEDDAPEPPEDPKSKVGDLWLVGRHRLICGDSTDVTVIDRLMDGQKADMVFTDPPYGINIVNDKGKVGAGNLAKNRTYSKVIADDTTETAQSAYNLLSKICDRLIIWGGNYFLDFLPASDGWLIWDKRIDMTSNNFADGEMAWCSFHTPVRIYHQLWNGMIREGEHEDRVHPTQKPIRMLGEILQDFTKEAEIIIDAFGGSGSTLIACEQLNRTCYTCELDPHYVDVIVQRYINLKGADDDVFLIREGQKIPWGDVK